jgi:thioredoxin-dependent peroxiredoxin
MKSIRLITFVLAAISLWSTDTWAQELKVGDMAPDFTLKASDGQTYTLSKLRGKTVVLAWFPKAFTGGWTAECRALRESGGLIRAFDVAYFMISTDTLEQNTAFAKQENADFPLLADPTQQTANKYGVLKDYGGDLGKLANRWTFYIGPDGKITAIDKAVKPASSGQDIVAKLKEIKVPAKKQWFLFWAPV